LLLWEGLEEGRWLGGVGDVVGDGYAGYVEGPAGLEGVREGGVFGGGGV
jgi:hypothetical protein